MRKRQGISVFNLSFLDVLSCGMGSVMLLSFIFAALPKDEVSSTKPFAIATIRLQENHTQPLGLGRISKLLSILLHDLHEEIHVSDMVVSASHPRKGVYILSQPSFEILSGKRTRSIVTKILILGESSSSWKGLLFLHKLLDPLTLSDEERKQISLEICTLASNSSTTPKCHRFRQLASIKKNIFEFGFQSK